MRDVLLKAARNNALWCDAVCGAQGAPGEFRNALWLNRSGTPLYYPDVITLAPEAAAEQIEAIAALVGSPRDSGWTVKDSFRSLDLRPLGFRVLFDAEWILRQPPATHAQASTAELSWRKVRTGADLLRWVEAWAGMAATAEASRIFAASLIARSDVSFLLATADDSALCGGILNEAAGVVGLSNAFYAGTNPEIVWRSLLREAARRYPGLPVVGYEAGEQLAAAQRAGFRTAGPLRIWTKG